LTKTIDHDLMQDLNEKNALASILYLSPSLL